MKNILTISCLLTILLATPFCKKNRLDEEVIKNSFSFQLNGQEWKPKGNNNTANLSIDYDPGIRNGVFNIGAYRIITTNEREVMGIGMTDSLNLLVAPFIIPLTNSGVFRLGFVDNECELISSDANTSVEGSLTIVRLDKVKGVIEGRFVASMSKSGCMRVSITNGYFKMKL